MKEIKMSKVKGPTKADLIYIILEEVKSNQWEYRRFILDCVENELKRWTKKELSKWVNPCEDVL